MTTRLICLLMGFAVFAGAQDDPPGRVGRLNFLAGSVSFQPGGVDEWVPASINRPLTTGDHIWVDEGSRAEIHVGSTAFRLDGRTAFEFLNLDDRTLQVRLAEGALNVRVRGLADGDIFEVDTPNMAFSILRPGEYRIDADSQTQTTMVTAFDGGGEVASAGQTFPLNPGEQARVAGDQQVSFDVGRAPGPDRFDEWAFSRDAREDRLQAARYVAPEMTGWEDLDAYGDWRPDPEYGTVWMPRTVSADWAPYREGHWAWIEPWGWTWVDNEPWGFAPFHYGRWAYMRGRWGWIPGPLAVRPVYAPALVGWIGGPRFTLAISAGGGGVGWFPLGPREVYVPSYHSTPGYLRRVNTSNTFINNFNFTNVNENNNYRYMNRAVPNAVTAVPRTVFANARDVGRSAVRLDPALLQSAVVVRTAQIVPNRDSVLGRSPGGVASRPPAGIWTRAVVARTPPPPAPVPFAVRRSALEAQPGMPLNPAVVRQIRRADPAAAQARPFVRSALSAGPGGRPPIPVRNDSRPAQFGNRGVQPSAGSPNPQFRPAPGNGPQNAAPGNDRRFQRNEANPAAAPQNAAPMNTPPQPNAAPGSDRRFQRNEANPAAAPQNAAPMNTPPPQNAAPGNDRRFQRNEPNPGAAPQNAAPMNTPPQNVAPGNDRRFQRNEPNPAPAPQNAAPMNTPPPQNAAPGNDRRFQRNEPNPAAAPREFNRTAPGQERQPRNAAPPPAQPTREGNQQRPAAPEGRAVQQAAPPAAPREFYRGQGAGDQPRRIEAPPSRRDVERTAPLPRSAGEPNRAQPQARPAPPAKEDRSDKKDEKKK